MIVEIIQDFDQTLRFNARPVEFLLGNGVVLLGLLTLERDDFLQVGFSLGHGFLHVLAHTFHKVDRSSDGCEMFGLDFLVNVHEFVDGTR